MSYKKITDALAKYSKSKSSADLKKAKKVIQDD